MGQRGAVRNGFSTALLVALGVLALPSPASAAVEPLTCTGPNFGPSGTPNFLFDDDMENPSSGNWAFSAEIPGDQEWSQGPTANVTSGAQALIGGTVDQNPPGGDPPSIYAATMTRDITVPEGGFLRFNHDYNFGTGDGGVIEYSVDGGATWNDVAKGGAIRGALAPGLFNYPGPLPATNPLGGPPRQGLSGDSGGYQTIRLPLDSVRGLPLRLRFVIGTDAATGGDPWFVDDVSIYNCPPTATITSGPADGTVFQARGGKTGAEYTFSSNGEQGRFDCQITDQKEASTEAYEIVTPCFSPFKLDDFAPTGQSGLPEGDYTLNVRAVEVVNAGGGTLYSPPVQRTFTVSYSCVIAESFLSVAKKKLKVAKERLKRYKKSLKKAEESGEADRIEEAEEKVSKAKKKVKGAKKKVKKAQARVDQECGTA